MRYIIRLSYDGSAFCGWQIQNNDETVQGDLEKALKTLTGTDVQVTGAGRTDSDVNAINYIAHFELPDKVRIEAAQLCYKLNAILPRQIAVHEVCETESGFHARFDARSREYHYFIHFCKDPFCERFSYRMRYPLDIERMNAAAAHLLGEHDFSCFEKTGGNNATSICTVTEAGWSTYRPDHVTLMGYPYAEGSYIVFRIKANRFLRNMVRAIVGSLIEVGRGKQEPGWIAELIEKGNRSDAGSSVPGKALFFSGASYK
ncbi:MAG: tRNA pseudouridine(38-40) synthase TruA [Bacteroidales bacterium]|nr:tRNA pseudouridine(38-40) synthase TruA [Bacteroidales bacterium]